MNIEKTIENIVAKCDNYIDPQLAICIIRDNCTMGSNNIDELKKYGIENEDHYVEKVLKVLKHENIFITFGMLAFIPMFNECDIFSIEDKTISLSSEEFQKYGDLKEEYFGILIKKNSNDFLIGSCDLCGCKIDSSFRQIKKSEDNFYKTINNIIENNIIYYPDLIKVGVRLDNGDITSVEARGFIMSHHKREVNEFSNSVEQAKKVVANQLKVVGSSKALISNDALDEKYCYEFKCKTEENEDVIVYINEKSLVEENIFIIIHTEGGTLTK